MREAALTVGMCQVVVVMTTQARVRDIQQRIYAAERCRQRDSAVLQHFTL